MTGREYKQFLMTPEIAKALATMSNNEIVTNKYYEIMTNFNKLPMSVQKWLYDTKD